MWQDTLVSTGLLPPILLNQILWPNSNSFTQSITFHLDFYYSHLGHCLSSLILLLNLPAPTQSLWKLFSQPPSEAAIYKKSTVQHQPWIDFSFMSKPQEQQQYEVSRTRDWLPFGPIWPPPSGNSHLVACWQLPYFIYFSIIGDWL